MNNLLFQIHTGCKGLGDNERKKLQPVRFDAAVRFTALPKVFETSNIDDTVGYHNLYAALESLVMSKEWFLLENLGLESFTLLKGMIPQDARLEVRVTKLKPSITPLMKDGVTVILMDD